jgi:hypothetical protein
LLIKQLVYRLVLVVSAAPSLEGADDEAAGELVSFTVVFLAGVAVSFGFPGTDFFAAGRAGDLLLERLDALAAGLAATRFTGADFGGAFIAVARSVAGATAPLAAAFLSALALAAAVTALATTFSAFTTAEVTALFGDVSGFLGFFDLAFLLLSIFSSTATFTSWYLSESFLAKPRLAFFISFVSFSASCPNPFNASRNLSDIEASSSFLTARLETFFADFLDVFALFAFMI